MLVVHMVCSSCSPCKARLFSLSNVSCNLLFGQFGSVYGYISAEQCSDGTCLCRFAANAMHTSTITQVKLVVLAHQNTDVLDN